MQDRALKRLDEIEGLNPDPSTGHELEAFELMTLFATGPEELGILIERYGGSTTPIIAQSLASVVAGRAQESAPGMGPTVLRVIAEFNCWVPAETVMNALTARSHKLHYVFCAAGARL